MQTVLLFGASGKLGQELKTKVDTNTKLYTPSHDECDITKAEHIDHIFDLYNPNIVIHTAALVGALECEENKTGAWRINVSGTVNIVKACLRKNSRLVFTSSAAIFDGKKGNYTENDTPTPINFYAVTKIAAEQAVRVLENSSIIRLDFFPRYNLKYNEIYTDHFASKIPVEEAAEKILTISNSVYKGIINIGCKRKSLYNILKPVFPNIKPITIASSKMPDYPHDLSLDTTIWQET